MFKSWKTTVAGIAAFFTASWGEIQFILDGDPSTVANFGVIVTAALVAFGFVGARDNNVSSEEAGATK